MKLNNFRRLDPEYTKEGKVGLSRGGKEEEIVWKEFADNPQRCHEVAEAIRIAIGDPDILTPGASTEAPGDWMEAEEGKKKLTLLHRLRERNKKIVGEKKAQALNKYGTLECEVCGFDFKKTYGIRGKGFIECHHTKPVHTLGAGHRTLLDGLVLLCANCHRMIHVRKPWLSIQDLQNIL